MQREREREREREIQIRCVSSVCPRLLYVLCFVPVLARRVGARAFARACFHCVCVFSADGIPVNACLSASVAQWQSVSLVN